MNTNKQPLPHIWPYDLFDPGDYVEEELGFQEIGIDDIVAVGRGDVCTDLSIYYYFFMFEQLKGEAKRNKILRNDPIHVLLFRGKYYVVNGNHRVSLCARYRSEIKTDKILAKVIRLRKK